MTSILSEILELLYEPALRSSWVNGTYTWDKMYILQLSGYKVL